MISLFGMLFFFTIFLQKNNNWTIIILLLSITIVLANRVNRVQLCCYSLHLMGIFLLSLLRLHLLHKSYSEKKTARREKERVSKRQRERANKSQKEQERLSRIRRNRRKHRDKAHQLHPKIRCKNKKITWNSCLLQFNAIKCITALSLYVGLKIGVSKYCKCKKKTNNKKCWSV